MRKWQRNDTDTSAAINLVEGKVILGKIKDFGGGGVWFQPLHSHTNGMFKNNISKSELSKHVGELTILNIGNNKLPAHIMRGDYHKNYECYGFGIRFLNPLYH